MLKYRKDNATGNELAMYWNDRPIPKEQREKYWMLEVERLKVELEEEKLTNKTMLKLADAIINSARKLD